MRSRISYKYVTESRQASLHGELEATHGGKSSDMFGKQKLTANCSKNEVYVEYACRVHEVDVPHTGVVGGFHVDWRENEKKLLLGILGIVSVSHSDRDILASLCRPTVRRSYLLQQRAFDRKRYGDIAGDQLERLQSNWPGDGATERLPARVEAVSIVDASTSTQRRRSSHGPTEMLTKTAVNEHVERRVGDNEQITESRVEEERMRTSEKAFIHHAVQRLHRYNIQAINMAQRRNRRQTITHVFHSRVFSAPKYVSWSK